MLKKYIFVEAMFLGSNDNIWPHTLQQRTGYSAWIKNFNNNNSTANKAVDFKFDII